MVEDAVVSDGTIHIFTFKQGLLSMVARDLRLNLDDFSLRVDGRSLRVVFRPATITVDGIIRRGRLDTTTLTDRERAEIQANIRSTVLETHRFPEAVLSGEVHAAAVGWRVDATLELKGVAQPLIIRARRDGLRVQGEIFLEPSRWGIKPFTALLGAIRLQDRVKVRFDLPLVAALP